MLNLDGMPAYVARPSLPGPHPAVVVTHLIFGLDAATRACADRLASSGFVAIAPDLYHRAAPGVVLPRTPEGRTRGLDLMRTLTRDGVTSDVARCLAWLRAEPGVTSRAGLLGVSLGGHVAFVAASRLDLSATAVLFPGWLTATEIPLSTPTPTVTLAPRLRGRLLFLVGDRDHVVPLDAVRHVADALAAAQVPHEVVVYAGEGHGFFPEPPPTADRPARPGEPNQPPRVAQPDGAAGIATLPSHGSPAAPAAPSEPTAPTDSAAATESTTSAGAIEAAALTREAGHDSAAGRGDVAGRIERVVLNDASESAAEDAWRRILELFERELRV